MSKKSFPMIPGRLYNSEGEDVSETAYKLTIEDLKDQIDLELAKDKVYSVDQPEEPK